MVSKNVVTVFERLGYQGLTLWGRILSISTFNEFQRNHRIIELDWKSFCRQDFYSWCNGHFSNHKSWQLWKARHFLPDSQSDMMRLVEPEHNHLERSNVSTQLQSRLLYRPAHGVSLAIFYIRVRCKDLTVRFELRRHPQLCTWRNSHCPCIVDAHINCVRHKPCGGHFSTYLRTIGVKFWHFETERF